MENQIAAYYFCLRSERWREGGAIKGAGTVRLSDGLVKMLARDKMPSSTPLSHFSSYSDRVAVKIKCWTHFRFWR